MVWVDDDGGGAEVVVGVGVRQRCLAGEEIKMKNECSLHFSGNWTGGINITN